MSFCNDLKEVVKLFKEYPDFSHWGYSANEDFTYNPVMNTNDFTEEYREIICTIFNKTKYPFIFDSSLSIEELEKVVVDIYFKIPDDVR